MKNFNLYDLVFFSIIAIAIIATSNPKYNGSDEISFMAIAVSYEESDINQIHKQVYDDLFTVWDEQTKEIFTSGANWRSRLYLDIGEFENNMNFHRAKPLFTVLVYLQYKVGIPLHLAVFFPGLISTILILLVVYFWLSKYCKRNMASVIIAVIALLPFTQYLANGTLSDTPCILFILWALYLLDCEAKAWKVLLLLSIAFLIRLDTCFLIASVCYFAYIKKMVKLNWLLIGLLAVLLISAVAIPILMGGDANWLTQYEFTNSFGDYWNRWINIFGDYRYPNLIFFLVIGIWLYRYSDEKAKLYLRISGWAVLLHLLAFPAPLERFVFAYEIVVLVMFVRWYSISKQKKPNHLKQVVNE